MTARTHESKVTFSQAPRNDLRLTGSGGGESKVLLGVVRGLGLSLGLMLGPLLFAVKRLTGRAGR